MILFLFSESILFPLIAGLVSFRRIGKAYRPFFLMIACAALTEPVSFLFIRTIHTNAIPNNLYALAEWLLVAWQFHIWGLFGSRKRLFYFLVAFVALIWITEDLVFGQITTFPPYFQVLYSFLIVLFSVNKINFMITHDDRKLYGNPIFLICIGFIILFVYKIIYEWAYQTSLSGATETTTDIIRLFSYINALVNAIFAIALLRIPHPQKFTLK
jgi:hypothetical protein